MNLLLLAVPALVAAPAPADPKVLDGLQERLEAIAEALIEGKPRTLKGLVAKASAAWAQAKPALRAVVPAAEATFIDRQLKAMAGMSPREQAVGALGISSALSRHQPRSRKQDLLQADRTAMLAWCDVDDGKWDRQPGLEAAFQTIIDQDKGQHAGAVVGVSDALKRFEESRQKHRAAEAKKALKDLLDLVDLLEK